MAKDDYDRIACLILAFLYARIKGKTDKDPEDFLQPMTKNFPIPEDYFNSIIEDLADKGYIKDISIKKAWGGDTVLLSGISKVKITGDGIHYLSENAGMRKVLLWMRDNAVSAPGLVTTIISILDTI